MEIYHFLFTSKRTFFGSGVIRIEKMEREEFRVVIKHCVKKKMSGKEIVKELSDTWGRDCIKPSTVYKWVVQFKQGRTSTCSDVSRSPPKTAITPENISAVEAMVTQDRRLTINHIAESLGLGYGTVR